MAFMNEKVSNADREKLVEMDLWSFMGTFPGKDIDSKHLMPYAWTIDKENDIAFFKGSQYKDPPYESKFGLLWKGKLVEFILLQEISGNRDVTWKKLKEKIPAMLADMRDELIEKLKEALKVYGTTGDFLPQYNRPNEINILF